MSGEARSPCSAATLPRALPVIAPERAGGWRRPRRFSRCLLAAVVALALALALESSGHAAPPPAPTIELFTRRGCPRCLEAEDLLDELRRERPELRVVEHDVADPEQRARLREVAEARGIATIGVPALLVGSALIVGFTPSTEARVRAALTATEPAPTSTEEGGTCGVEPSAPCPAPSPGPPDDTVVVPLLGAVSARSLGLPLFTIVIGLLDGFNPCSMWVLLLLLSFLTGLGSRWKTFVVGGTYVAVSALVYFAFLAAWLEMYFLLGLARPVQVALGLVAIAIGSIDVKDFFAFRRGVTLSIPEAVKPGIYRRMRALASSAPPSSPRSSTSSSCSARRAFPPCTPGS